MAQVASCRTWQTPSLPHIERFRLDAPDGREVLLTPGCRTVVVDGPPRAFGHDGSLQLDAGRRVRLLSAPFAGGGLTPEIVALAAAETPDIFDLVAQYLPGMPPLFNDDGLRIAGSASYGPVDGDGKRRLFGSDFNDYLGIAWEDDGQRIDPDPARDGMVDCSGFVRLVYGYRSGLPLRFAPRRGTLPRHTWEMATCDVGRLVAVLSADPAPSALDAILPGDLVFWGSPTRMYVIYHVGIYVGIDERGRPCAFSSRGMSNGPILHDLFDSLDESVFYLVRRL